MVADHVRPLLVEYDVKGPIKGQPFLKDIRALCNARKNTILAESTAAAG